MTSSTTRVISTRLTMPPRGWGAGRAGMVGRCTWVGACRSVSVPSAREADVTAGVEDLKLRVLPYSAQHAFHLFDLPTHHADPFDRQIIAQALAEDLAVVTPDSAFHLYKGLKVVW